MENFKQVDPAAIDGNFIRMIGREWMLVTAGDGQTYNTMTASWGFAGEMWGRHAAVVAIRPGRYTYRFVERNPRLTLSFLDEAYRGAMQWCGTHSGREGDKFAATGLTPAMTDDGVPAIAQARLILQCRKLYADDIRPGNFIDPSCDGQWYPEKDYHRMYVVEIEKAYLRE